MIPRTVLPALVAVLSLFCSHSSAQAQDFQKEQAAMAKKAASALLAFAKVAKAAKVGPRAKQAYDLVLEYDPDNSRARRELGFKKNKGEWQMVELAKRKRWTDEADYKGRFKVATKWRDTAQKLGDLHADFAKAVADGGSADGDSADGDSADGNNEVLAKTNYEKAIYYNPMQETAHQALGHKEGKGFFGTERQVAFAERMVALETKATEIAQRDFEVEALPQEKMPKEYQALIAAVPDWMKEPDFEIHGAKSEHFTVWTRGTQENADNCVKWAERALQFGLHVLGEDGAKDTNFVQRATKSFNWFGFVWTAREREEFLKANPHTWKEEGSLARAKEFANTNWKMPGGELAVVHTRNTPSSMHDTMIAYVFQYGLGHGRNSGLGQGIVHAATWYLQSTSISKWGARPEGTVAAKEENLPQSTSWWMRAMRDQAASGQDAALDQVPRERLSSFRNDVRMKAWSYTTWVWAAYPEQWLDFYLLFEADLPLPEKVHEVGAKAFGKPLLEVEAEWREWARGDSGVAAATGYGPPLLPELPSDAELEVLERLTVVRAQNLAFTWAEGEDMRKGTFGGLPPCDLDAEASQACEDHARFLSMWPDEHLRWPEAHEENPALAGFTPRGMRAAMSSVIVSTKARAGKSFPEESVDGWLGTPYHRFPLLKHNVKRIGYAYLFENDYTIAVLDMASLAGPYNPKAAPKFVVWPAHNLEAVPTSFHGRERPNPLADQAQEDQDITKTGYPISLQMQRELAVQLVNAEIELYTVKGAGKQPDKHLFLPAEPVWEKWRERCGGPENKPVPLWVHTPRTALNRRVEEREVIFAIPKEPLETKQAYQVRVKLEIGGNEAMWFVWEFETGRQAEGLRLK